MYILNFNTIQNSKSEMLHHLVAQKYVCPSCYAMLANCCEPTLTLLTETYWGTSLKCLDIFLSLGFQVLKVVSLTTRINNVALVQFQTV